MQRRITLLSLGLALAVAACADPSAPTKPSPEVHFKDRLATVAAQMTPRPAGADTVDYYNDNINFKAANPCTGDTVVVYGILHYRGWQHQSDSLVQSDIFTRGDTLHAVGLKDGVHYDVLYYSQQLNTRTLGADGVWRTDAHVHRVLFYVHEFTWQTFLTDDDYRVQSPPFVYTPYRADKLCADW